MKPLHDAFLDFRDAARRFTRPARHYLGAEFLAWTGHGIFAVLYNLYLVEAGFQEGFVGQAISVNAFGLALAALPAGWLADRYGRLRVLKIGALLDGAGFVVRSSFLDPGVILGASFVAGTGQSLLAIAAAPFITEHSSPRERTHLFSSFFAISLLAGVAGNVLGGVLPWLLLQLPEALRPSTLAAYRAGLLLGGAAALAAWIPLARLGRLEEATTRSAPAEPVPPAETRKLVPIALNSLLLGLGAGLVIPFMNLYFRNRFDCSSAQIGVFFSVAQVFTAFASLLGPAVARRFGKLRTAVGSELMSLPFLVTLGAEGVLGVAVGAFWIRATLMQAAAPLLQNFVMEALPGALRSRASSLNNLVWNVGWAFSSSVAGLVIQRLGYAMPFYVTAVLYATAAISFYLAFRGMKEGSAEEVRVSEEAKGHRGEGPLTE